MDTPGFHHLAIQVHDLSAAESFYAGLLDLPVIRRWSDDAGAPRSLWVGLGGGGFLALERCSQPATPRGWELAEPGLFVLALQIPPESRQAWEVKLARAGHPTERETRFSFYVRDPDGNRIALSHHPRERD